MYIPILLLECKFENRLIDKMAIKDWKMYEFTKENSFKNTYFK